MLVCGSNPRENNKKHRSPQTTEWRCKCLCQVSETAHLWFSSSLYLRNMDFSSVLQVLIFVYVETEQEFQFPLLTSLQEIRNKQRSIEIPHISSWKCFKEIDNEQIDLRFSPQHVTYTNVILIWNRRTKVFVEILVYSTSLREQFTRYFQNAASECSEWAMARSGILHSFSNLSSFSVLRRWLNLSWVAYGWQQLGSVYWTSYVCQTKML